MKEGIICPLTGRECRAGCNIENPKCEQTASDIADNYISRERTNPGGIMGKGVSFFSRKLLLAEVKDAESKLSIPRSLLKERVARHLYTEISSLLKEDN